MPSGHTSEPAAYAPDPAPEPDPPAAIFERLEPLSEKIAVGVPPPLHNTSEDVGWYITFTCAEGSGQVKSFMNLLTDNAMFVN